MMQTTTITHHDAVASLNEALAAAEAAHPAGIRMQMRHLVQQRVIAGTVANATLARLGIAPLRDRFLVGARLPVTVMLCAPKPDRAQYDAAGLIVAALKPLRVGYLRGRTPVPRPARRPAVEAVTATRVLNQVRNPRLPSRPVFTVAATVLLGVTLAGTDRDTAWAQAHQQLSAELSALRALQVRLHVEALSKTWVRNLGPEPITVHRQGR
jgi:hypothetical protein